jgi:lipopolysaccharide transport system ATP-binding protein
MEDAFMANVRRWRNIVTGIGRDLRQKRKPLPGRYLPKRQSEDFWALRDISFDLRYGEVLGVIGPNGAGKSTLLKILSQVLTPTEGQAELYGQVGALLEVGTGFNPELSGRENIYLYGSILGMTRTDISKRFDEIVAFAEIERFLEQPIKHYSTGMHSRLAFSVAAHLECEILLVDEVLAVGDAAFRNKCIGKMQNVTGQGRAVIFVSHNMAAINTMCQSGIVLRNGKISYYGDANEASKHYLGEVDRELAYATSNPLRFDPDPNLPGQISSVSLADHTGQTRTNFAYNESPVVNIELQIRIPSRDYYLVVLVEDEGGNLLIFATDETRDGLTCVNEKAEGQYGIQAVLPSRLFKPGKYRLTVGIQKHKDGRVDKRDRCMECTITEDGSEGPLQRVRHRRHLIEPPIEWREVTPSPPDLSLLPTETS